MKYTNNAFKNVTYAFFFFFLAGLFGYATRIVLARSLSTSEFGLFYAVFSFFSFFSYFRTWGLNTTLAKILPEFLVRRATVKRSNALGIVLRVELFSGLFLSLLAIATAGWLAKAYFHDESARLLVILFTIPFVALGLKETGRALLQGYQRMRWHAGLYALENLLLLGAIMFCLQWTQTALAPVLAYAIVFTSLAVFNLFVATRGKCLWRRRFSFDRILWQRMRSLGLAFMLGGLASMVYLYTDTLVLTYFRSLAEVGVYGVVVVVAMMLTFFTKPLQTVLFPLVSELWIRQKLESLRAGVSRVNVFVFVLILPLGFVFIAFPDTLLTLLFGVEYVSGAGPLQVLVVATFCLVLAQLNLNVLNGAGYPQVARNLGVTAAVLNLLLNLLLIPSYGLYAAAGTTLASYALLFVGSSRAMTTRLSLSLPWSRWARTLFSGGVMLVVLFLVKGYFARLPILFSLALPLLVAVSVYTALLFATHAFTSEDYRFVRVRIASLFKKA